MIGAGGNEFIYALGRNGQLRYKAALKRVAD